MEELAAIAAIAEVISNFYGAFQAIANLIGFGGSGPDVDDEILDALQGISQQLAQVQDAITALAKWATLDLAFQELSVVSLLVTEVSSAKALANTAADEYAEWVQGGRTDAAMLDLARNNSLQAANAILDTTTFWYLPFANQAAGIVENIFDYRIAITQYVYALTVRLTVIMGAEPAWDADPSILAELTAHAQWLGTVVTQMQAGIQPVKGTGVIPEGSSYYYWVQMADTVSGMSAAAYQSDQVFSSSQEAAAQLSVMETAQSVEVRNQIGLTTVMLFQSLLAWYLAGSPTAATWTPWLAVAPSIGSDASLNMGVGSLFPLTACSSELSGLSLFWVASDGSVNARQMSGGAWGQPTVVMPAGTAGAPVEEGNPLGATVLQAVSTQAGNTVLAWTTADGAIQGSFYDTRATSPAWAQPFTVVAATPPYLGVTTPNGLLATVATGPGEVTVFWTAAGTPAFGSLMTCSFQLSAVQSGGDTEVVASAPTAPVLITEEFGLATPFAAASGGPGNVIAFWIVNDALMSTYYDQRAAVPEWATPFTIAPVTGFWFGLAAVGSAPYTVDAFWQDATSVSTSSYSVQREEVSLPGKPPFAILSRTTPTAPAPVAPSGAPGTQSLQIAAVSYVVDHADLPPGAAWVFWMTELQAIQGTSRTTASAGWAAPVTLGAPLGEVNSPVVAVSPAASTIAVFMHATDGTIVESHYQPPTLIAAPPIHTPFSL